MAQTIRPVASLEELAAAIEIIDQQVADMVTPDERRYRDLPSSYPQYRDLMLLAEVGDQLVGAVLGIGPPDGPGGEFSVLVKGLGVCENHRGTGLGRQLLERLEVNAAAMGGG